MPRPKQHTVSLTAKDRRTLERTVSSASRPRREVARARILLALDEADGPAPYRRVVAERVGVSEGTVYKIAKAFNDRHGSAQGAIRGKRRAAPPVAPKVTGDVEAKIIALARAQPPEGHSRWTLRLLERHVLLIDGMPPLDHSTIGRVLKRGTSNRA
jgi:transposase